jgi:thiamine-monophosphate kinase
LEEQKKYNIKLCGGDTTFSKKLSFSITVIGFSKKLYLETTQKLMMISMSLEILEIVSLD